MFCQKMTKREILAFVYFWRWRLYLEGQGRIFFSSVTNLKIMKVNDNDIILDLRKPATQMNKKYFVDRFLHVAHYGFS